jgi:hypothetical protein
MIGMTRTIPATSIQASDLRGWVELVQPMRLAPVGAVSRAAAGGVLGLLLVEPVLFAAVGAAGAELSTSRSTSGSCAGAVSPMGMLMGREFAMSRALDPAGLVSGGPMSLGTEQVLRRLTTRSLEHETVDSGDVGVALSRVPGRREPVGVTGHAASAPR